MRSDYLGQALLLCRALLLSEEVLQQGRASVVLRLGVASSNFFRVILRIGPAQYKLRKLRSRYQAVRAPLAVYTFVVYT